MKKSDLFVGLYILAAIVFLIVSIPSAVLDILLAFNIAVALVTFFKGTAGYAGFSYNPAVYHNIPYIAQCIVD